MNDEIQSYHEELLRDVEARASAAGILAPEAFLEIAGGLVGESEGVEITGAYHESGDGAQRLRIDGHGGPPDENGGELWLVVCDFSPASDVETFDRQEAARLLNPLLRFVKKAREARFRDELNETSPGYQAAELITSHWSAMAKIRLVLLSNRRFASRSDNAQLSSDLVTDKPLVQSILDIARLADLGRKGREDLVVALDEFGGPLPALPASAIGDRLRSYLTVIPGKQLADIYDRWGERLLEGNVRSFLQARAKTNKGMAKTIREQPSLFFPYNNGISATASAVTTTESARGTEIATIYDLQIVNGAQTTGTIHASRRSAELQLAEVYVQMKLTVVPKDLADGKDGKEGLVAKISEFANTQNKVSAADFFSNHPFHVEIEKFSRQTTVPHRSGAGVGSKWFYERSRGQYHNARSRAVGAERTKFDREYPKPQLFTKTDLAKFEQSYAGYPHVVSRGAQKNFAEFATRIGKAWREQRDRIDAGWYRQMIAKGIIFRALDNQVARQEWFCQGYKANVVTYAIAKLVHDAAEVGKEVDLGAVWQRQRPQDGLLACLLRAGEVAQAVILEPEAGMSNISEWAKKQACWASLQRRAIEYPESLADCLITPDERREAARTDRRDDAMTKSVLQQSQVVNLGAAYWEQVRRWAVSHRFPLSPKGAALLGKLGSGRGLPSEFDAADAMTWLERLRAAGMPDRFE
jgi:hypothetical protein